MKLLNRTIQINGDSNYIREIIEFNNKKFKLVADIHNGGRNLEAYIMVDDGSWKMVIYKDDIQFKLTESYVVKDSRMNNDLEKGINELKKVIKDVYQ